MSEKIKTGDIVKIIDINFPLGSFIPLGLQKAKNHKIGDLLICNQTCEEKQIWTDNKNKEIAKNFEEIKKREPSYHGHYVGSWRKGFNSYKDLFDNEYLLLTHDSCLKLVQRFRS